MKDQSDRLFLEAALKYAERNLSIIPVKPDKKPFIKWEEYQARRATPDEIKGWWGKWPNAMIGLVTGRISGIVVIDIDTEEGREAIQDYIPDSLIIPTATTPKGGQHLYFKCPEKHIGNNARTIPGCDLRAEGGYIIAPPSVNGTGQHYKWLEGLSIEEVELPDLPDAYLSYINSYALGGYKGGDLESHAESRGVTGSHKILTLGRRDNDLFHVAYCLGKERTPTEEIEQCLEILAKNCNPPFPLNEIEEKIKSALKRVDRRERNIAEDLRKWVEVTDGHFGVTEYHAESRVVTKEEKHAVIVCLQRLVREGVLEKYGNKRGVYRKIEAACEEIDYLNAGVEVVYIRWPFGIEQYVRTLPKNVIIIAGEPNSGKTAFLLNTIKMNQDRHDIHYFSSEMGPIELKDRLSKFDIPLNSWRFTPRERASNFSDVIRPDAINIIDYLEIHDEFYRIGGMIKEIYDKLQKGIAIIAIQKNRGSEYGLGGGRGLEKARLYLSMEQGAIKIVKAKNWVNSYQNPNGLEMNFKLVRGCKFISEGEWSRHV